MSGYDQIELRAAAARLMINDNRDIRDYNLLIEFIDDIFRTEKVLGALTEEFERRYEEIWAKHKARCEAIYKGEPQNE